MLTRELISFRIGKETIQPDYISRVQAHEYLEIAKSILEIFHIHVGHPRKEIWSCLEKMEEGRLDYKRIRGLIKLVDDQALWEPVLSLDYPQLRETIFLEAQKYYPIVKCSDLIHPLSRTQVLERIAYCVGKKPEEIESLLYGDLEENLVLKGFQKEYTPEMLLKRYNLALAQGLLYWASRMEVWIWDSFRTVIQYIKLAGLMHSIFPLPDGGYYILLDGPISLFSQTQRYGIRMAQFLPGLLLSRKWRMRAFIHTPYGEKRFELNSSCGLTTFYEPISLFDSKVEEAFYNKFLRKGRDWKIAREAKLIQIGDEVFIPDFSFRNSEGKSVDLEIMGFWTPQYLTKKLEKIRKASHSSLILAVNRHLNCTEEEFHGPVIYFTHGIKISDVLRILEKFS